MIASSTVNGDASSIKDLFSNYKEAISSIGTSSWEGASKDNLDSNADSFISSYPSAIATQMSNFSSAITKYGEYKTAKSNMNSALSSKNSATEEETKSYYAGKYDEYSQQVTRLDKEIKELLSTVKSNKLDDAVTTLENAAKKGNWSINNFKFYSQGWYKDVSYGYGKSIAAAGCGPTAMAMVLSNLLGKEIDPVVVANYAMKHGFRYENAGTDEGLFPSIAQAYNVKCVQQSQTTGNIVNSLKQGNLIVAHMGPGTFTSGGHYIVLAGVSPDGSKVYVFDPNGGKHNGWYSTSLIEKERKGSIYSCSV